MAEKEPRVIEGRLSGGSRKRPEGAPVEFSVVTAVYNNAEGIRRLIANIAEQTFENLEHVIVDGGSTDGTIEVLQELDEQIDCWISESDEGIYDAMNKGIGLARGNWIHLLNSDDEYASPNAVASAVEQLDPAAFNYCAIELVRLDEKRERLFFLYRRWKLFVSAYLPHPGCIVSAEQYKKFGLYDTKYKIAADHELILRYTDVLPPHALDVTLTRMFQGGASSMAAQTACEEFRAITTLYGCPSILARVLKFLRLRRSKVKSAE